MIVNAISAIGNGGINNSSTGLKVHSNPLAVKKFSGYSKASSQALKLNGLNLSRTVRFTGSLLGAFQELNTAMVTCKTKDSKGESVGSRASVNKLLHDYQNDFSQPNDAIKTTVQIGTKKIDGKDAPIKARTQIKLLDKDDRNDKQTLLFEMAVREPSKEASNFDKCDNLKQNIAISMTPINYKGKGILEQAYVLNTKGNLMAVVEDNNDVLLTNAGSIKKKDDSDGKFEVSATEAKNIFKPFEVNAQPVKERKPMPSVGEGTEIVIGMEDGRFENEIKDSIKTFVEKVKNGEIVLDQFKAMPNAKDTQLVMLAGGFGSRAEYTNASSSAIFHDEEDGTQSTKGVFRTATGLTPMETTFVTLHNAGLLDCSKDALEIGKNIKFYLNKTGNKGNGGYSVGLQKTMARPDRKAVMLFPNDAMSRMTNAVVEANKIMAQGNAAIVMIAKEVPAKDCINNFGIMKLGENNEILEFAEKPPVIPEGYEKNGKCLTNTFQFAVSDEAFEVLDLVEPFFSKTDKSKETRDWSKQYVPILKTLTQENDNNVIREKLAPVFGPNSTPIDDETIKKAKDILKNQKIIAVPTNEPWADCGTLNQLYHTTMQIASGDFPLEDFERAHLISCIDTKTGLVATSPEQKERIASKYEIQGQVMVAPQAKVIDVNDIKDIPVTVNEAK